MYMVLCLAMGQMLVICLFRGMLRPEESAARHGGDH